MKVGVDGVLLGAWATEEHPNHILDIGTGSGIIALMLAQRFKDATITAIEPNTKAHQQAQQNFAENKLGLDINLVQSTLQKFSTAQKFDLIVSNPPFFKQEVPSGNQDRDEARQAKHLPLSDLFFFAKKHLSKDGSIHLIYPSENSKEVINSAESNQLFLKEKMIIIPAEGKISKRTLFSFSFVDQKAVEAQIVIEKERNHFTEEYIALTKEFYLNF